MKCSLFRKSKNLFLIMFFLIEVFFGEKAYSQIYSNGELSTGLLTKSNVVARTGYNWSELQNDAIVTSEVNVTTGTLGCYTTDGTTNFQLADDFVVPELHELVIESFDFYIYQNSYIGTAIPIDQLRIEIWDGDPSLPSSSVVVGNMTANVLDNANSGSAFIYRIQNSIIGSPTIFQPNNNRLVWRIRGNISATLKSGTYWVVYQYHAKDNGFIAYSPFVTVLGKRGKNYGNAKQNYKANTNPGEVLGWRSVIDKGYPSTAVDVPQDLPFQINGVHLLGVKQNDFSSIVNIYPVPVIDIIKVNAPEDILINDVEVFDISGRKVIQYKNTILNSFDIDVCNLSKGTYILKLNSDIGFAAKKFIKD